MTIKRKLLLLAFVFNLNINAISNKKANKITAIRSISAASIYALLYGTYSFNNMRWYEESKDVNLRVLKTSVLFGLITYGISKFIFSFYLPEEYLKSIKKNIEFCERPLKLLNKQAYDKNSLIDEVKKAYINSEFPLADAFHGFTKTHKALLYAVQYLNKNKMEFKNELLIADVESILNQFDKSFFSRLEEAMSIVKENKNFNEQVNLKNTKNAADDLNSNLRKMERELEWTNVLISLNNIR